MQRKQFIFVPQWIDDKLRLKGLDTSALLDIEKVASLFSIEDLATMQALVDNSQFFTGYKVKPDTLCWLEQWRSSAKSAKTEKLVADVQALSEQENFAEETLQRIFEQESSLGEKNQSKTFDVSPLGNEGVKVLIHSGFPREKHLACSYELFRSMVKALHVYEEYASLISRHIGRTYVETLQTQ